MPILNIENNDSKLNIDNNSITLIKYLFKNYNSMYNNISEISESNSRITLTTDTKTKIFIKHDMIIENINKLKKFENTIQTMRDINDYKYIDLMYRDQVVVKEKKYI